MKLLSGKLLCDILHDDLQYVVLGHLSKERLDKDTSGCLVIAKNDGAHQSLTAQFAARSTEKRYLTEDLGFKPEIGY